MTDNEKTWMRDTYPIMLKINRTLALKMGWLKEKEDGRCALGPNLIQEFFTDEVPDLSKKNHDLVDKDGTKPVFWLVDQGLLLLSCTCNWRFTNLNKGFENLTGNQSRSLFVYSDAGGSGVVGDQVTDLLREVNMIRTGAGVQYFEPLHTQYIDIPKQELDIIETQVAETTGELTQFGVGITIVTLHYKKT